MSATADSKARTGSDAVTDAVSGAAADAAAGARTAADTVTGGEANDASAGLARGLYRARGAIFVYYRVPRARADSLRAAFARMASDPLPLAGLGGVELMRRAGDDENALQAETALQPEALQTWMEIYPLAPDLTARRSAPGGVTSLVDFERLQQAIEARARDAGIVELVDGERHYEAFVACA